ncbi:MAG: motility associated factor glycosyltransferase family protein, partial [Nitrospinae bacterium]|nr:motility associated factor glycosyltransferase family protein [Nitrospinota bacterium]
MADFLKNNLTLLKRKFPDTASLLQAAPVEKNYSSTRSRSGPITGARIFPDGSTRNLHSTYDPVQEAARFIDTCLTNGDSNFLVTGFGFGYHLLELVRRVPASSRIVMIEKDPELARLALSHNDFSSVFNHPGMSFHVGIGPEDLEQILHDCRTDWSINGYTTVGFKPLIDAEKEYYFAIQEGLKQIYQKARVDLGTQAVFSKTFYDNIFANGKHLLNSSGIRSLEQTLHGVPAIVVSAGPSLDKNISLLKNSADNILIVAVATALRPLVESGVKPDFVVAVD